MTRYLSQVCLIDDGNGAVQVLDGATG